MADWFKKNIIFVIINSLISIVLIVIGFSVTRVVSAMDNKAEKAEVAIEFENIESEIKALVKKDDDTLEYVDDQNTKQDEARDKMDELVLKRLDYIISRVDKMSTK